METRRRREAERREAERQRAVQDTAARVIQSSYRRAFRPEDEWLEPPAEDDGQGDGQDDSEPPRQEPPELPAEPREEPAERASARRADDQRQRLLVTPRRSSLQVARQHAAAISIQSAVRGALARRVVAAARARRLSRSYIERHHVHVVLARALELEDDFLRALCAVKIQALVRGRQTRLLLEAARIGQHVAAGVVQRAIRRHLAALASASARGVRSLAARAIQAAFRRHWRRTRPAIDEELDGDVRHIAASTIQQCWRRVCGARDQELRELEAATCIQALARGHLARQSVQSLRSSQASAFSMGTMPSTAQLADPPRDPDDDELLYDELFEDAEHDGARSPARPLGNENLSFLPPAARAAFVRDVQAHGALPLEACAARIATWPTSVSVDDMALMGFTLDDLLHELERRQGDERGACATLTAIASLVLGQPERFRSMPQLVKVLAVVDRWLTVGGDDDDGAAAWPHELEQRVVTLLHVFSDVLGVECRQSQ
ncbi:hypothetical protein ATCC90586_007257 [Pythium insidiosum]|nr:hypothetical protein ATCC90586_007257 [Pythium insidiosum]